MVGVSDAPVLPKEIEYVEVLDHGGERELIVLKEYYASLFNNGTIFLYSEVKAEQIRLTGVTWTSGSVSVTSNVGLSTKVGFKKQTGTVYAKYSTQISAKVDVQLSWNRMRVDVFSKAGDVLFRQNGDNLICYRNIFGALSWSTINFLNE